MAPRLRLAAPALAFLEAVREDPHVEEVDAADTHAAELPVPVEVRPGPRARLSLHTAALAAIP